MKRTLLSVCILLLSYTTFGIAQSQPTVHILVAYDSRTGNTEKLAQAIGRGAASLPGVQVTVQKMADVKDDAIPSYDGVLVGTPIHWSNMTARTKEFLDRVGGALWKNKTNGDGRTAGVFCTGGSVAMGKDVARLSIISALMIMRYTIIGGVDETGFGTLGPQATTGAADKGMSDKELEEGRRFGERFARLTLQFHAPAPAQHK